MKQALDLQGLASGGDSWTRTNDPIDVNDVLYRLSHATTLLVYTSYHFGLPTEPCHHNFLPLAYQSSWTFGTVRPARLWTTLPRT